MKSGRAIHSTPAAMQGSFIMCGRSKRRPPGLRRLLIQHLYLVCAQKLFGVRIVHGCFDADIAEVVDRARVILAELDKKKIALTYQAEEGGELPMEGQIPIFSAPGSSAHTDSIRTELRDLDISRLTPLEAMNILYSFIEKAKGTE